MTEEEARTKWCPMVRSVGGVNRGYNGKSMADTLCLASDCMMWRWRNSDLKHGDCGLVGN